MGPLNSLKPNENIQWTKMHFVELIIYYGQCWPRGCCHIFLFISIFKLNHFFPFTNSFVCNYSNSMAKSTVTPPSSLMFNNDYKGVSMDFHMCFFSMCLFSMPCCLYNPICCVQNILKCLSIPNLTPMKSWIFYLINMVFKEVLGFMVLSQVLKGGTSSI
jgi:hypothetical protein